MTTDQDRGFARTLSSSIADSFLFARGRRLWELNKQNWFIPLTKVDKALIGLYLVLSDYAKGAFPPRFESRETAYANEIAYDSAVPGLSGEDFNTREIAKPFWGAKDTRIYLRDYLRILGAVERSVHRGARILDLACGTGWISELLAIEGYDVVGASLAPFEIALAERRIKSLRAKGLEPRLKFMTSAMENLDGISSRFEFVFIYEALHHAFSWQSTLEAVSHILEPGGWFYICAEPNIAHTVIAYRGTKQLKTHEIGLNRKKLKSELRRNGFIHVHSTHNQVNTLACAHWILAQKPSAPKQRPVRV
jgi:2-polyprenyl-3-methyl-5-hydroxy-6-metoxy-1,4-benzoquinol methylase